MANLNNRQEKLLKILEQNQVCNVKNLAETFEVSDETIRRDIKQLQNLGLVEKQHGSVRVRESILETSYLARMNENQTLKNRIGIRASELVEDGMALFIDSSTTAYYAALHLRGKKNLSIVTNSLDVARIMALCGDNKIYLCGGEINPHYLSAFGTEAIEFAKRYSPEIAFVSVAAMDSEKGALDFLLDEADFISKIAPLSRRIILLVDSPKFHKHGLMKALDYAQIDTIITDCEPPEEFSEALKNVNLIIAE